MTKKDVITIMNLLISEGAYDSISGLKFAYPKFSDLINSMKTADDMADIRRKRVLEKAKELFVRGGGQYLHFCPKKHAEYIEKALSQI